MIDGPLFDRYRAVFGETFTVGLWDRRPGDAVNAMMRAALAGGPVVTDDAIAADLAARIGPPGEPA